VCVWCVCVFVRTTVLPACYVVFSSRTNTSGTNEVAPLPVLSVSPGYRSQVFTKSEMQFQQPNADAERANFAEPQAVCLSVCLSAHKCASYSSWQLRSVSQCWSALIIGHVWQAAALFAFVFMYNSIEFRESSSQTFRHYFQQILHSCGPMSTHLPN